MVKLGAAVGTVAAQSIGEPGTQLHCAPSIPACCAGGDITTGLPRVEELFEARRMPKGEAVVSAIKGTAHLIVNEKNSELRTVKVENSEMVSDTYKSWTVGRLKQSKNPSFPQ